MKHSPLITGCIGLLVVCFAATAFGAALDNDTVTISKSVLKDKIMGAWEARPSA